MDVKNRLVSALQAHAANEWAVVALSALGNEHVVFAGNVSSGASSTAADLLRVYRLRQAHCREQGIEACGLAELIESLSAHDANDVIEGQPFLAPTGAVHAFWNSSGDLIGCVTILGLDAERGRRNLSFALGKG
ncbi:hypothetical protein [Bradyrhizobium cosmicum]|uniref:hypothetical protein n=1 Tax=Bradyrhizobium cosmicum TaxID=1404864 RepID=UPI0011650C59|nr:hypothetical protein [Bradyrhizobium cosmicum]QDP26706.1 hypothetical protein FNV92_33145 [Bradyrhizobium cosmicum]